MDKNIKKSISVIIATFNGYKYIEKAIDSVLDQTFKDFEIIVVDDGSTDKRLYEIIEPYISKNIIKYVYEENKGPGAARNLGVEISSGEYISFLDDDDYWDKNKLRIQFDLMEKKSNCVVCYTDSWIIDPSGNINKKTKKEIIGNLYEGKILNKIVFNNFITLSSSLVRKDSFIKMGFFTENRDFYMIEDFDLWLKLATIGNFCLADEPLVYYRTRLPLSRKQKYIEYKKLIKLFLKYFITSKKNIKYIYLLGLMFYITKYIYHRLNFIFKRLYG